MMLEPRDPAAAESYPTFWDEPLRNSAVPHDSKEDAYMTFVNLIEDDLPPEDVPDID